MGGVTHDWEVRMVGIVHGAERSMGWGGPWGGEAHGTEVIHRWGGSWGGGYP